MRQEELGIHSAQARACTGTVARNAVSHPCILKTCSSPCIVARKCRYTLPEQGLSSDMITEGLERLRNLLKVLQDIHVTYNEKDTISCTYDNVQAP